MFKLVFIVGLFLPNDSISTDSIAIVKPNIPISLMHIESFQYQHKQGFFCDFEDKINKNKKIIFNFGVGEN